MPVYEFECLKCRTRFEKLCGMGAGVAGVCCPSCQSSDVKRLISSFYSRSSSGGGSAPSSSGCSACSKSSCAGCK
ncbi:MAG TPA: zinc ribbon domain-containing protein [Armatimonadota bacterium]|nr:zinc ribbon domain-containing protein [Armatimonadota bacterium]